MKKRSLLLLCGMLIISTITGCGSSASTADTIAYEYNDAATASKSADYYESNYDAEYYEDYAAEEDYESLGALESASSESKNSSVDALEYEDKLVYEANISLETLDFDKTYGELVNIIKKYDGRIESEQYDAHYGSYTTKDSYKSGYHTTKQDYLVIRIPSKYYNDFISSNTKLGNITEKTQSLTNITQSYYSTKTKVELLEGQLDYYKHQLNLIEEKLMDCEDYEYVIEQMVELEDRIIYVQDQINQCNNSVKTMDMQVTYSTIYLNLVEVKEYSEITNVVDEEDTFFSRFKENVANSTSGFLKFLEGLLTVIIFVLPYLLLFGAIAGIIIAILSKISKLTAKNGKRVTTNQINSINNRTDNKANNKPDNKLDNKQANKDEK